ncbi:MAG TPA: DUF4160 domain-containing protein [Spirochaetes bacterium]|nr:DUF4160 domain-containing protein [Spirochaetota bacterium]
MPIVLRYKGYRFFFFSNEGKPLKPLHIHVRKDEKVAKFWIEPEIALAETYAFSSSELNGLAKIIETNKTLIERSWNEYFGE